MIVRMKGDTSLKWAVIGEMVKSDQILNLF